MVLCHKIGINWVLVLSSTVTSLLQLRLCCFYKASQLSIISLYTHRTYRYYLFQLSML